MSSIDIVLVKPGAQKKLYGELSAFNLTAIEPPMWAALLAAVLLQQGYSVELIDAEVMNWTPAETAEKIRELNPLLVAIMVSGTNPSASTMNMSGVHSILERLYEIAPKITTLLAGLHPSALPGQTLRDEKVNFVCQGEGIETLPSLIEALKSKTEDFKINGLWYKVEGQIVSNPRPELVKNLNELPMPAWHLLPMDKYRAHNWHCFDNIDHRQPYGVIYTSLGCPFQCSFCCINALFGKPGIRLRSPKRVIEEIDFLVSNFNIKNIKIIDEMFAYRESHISEICSLIQGHGHDLNIWAYARVNTVTPKMLSWLKSGGVNWLAYGFESASKKVLKDVSKGFDVDTVDNVVEMTRDAGIYICSNYMFGLPEDDRETMRATLDKAKEINAEWANFQATIAYPGSKLYDKAIDQRLPLPETWEGFSQHAYETLPLPTNYLAGAEVLVFRDAAFNEYYSNADYLNMIEKKFGIYVVEHIKEMTAHEIPRRVVVNAKSIA